MLWKSASQQLQEAGLTSLCLPAPGLKWPLTGSDYVYLSCLNEGDSQCQQFYAGRGCRTPSKPVV